MEWCMLNDFCFGYLGIFGQLTSQFMFIPPVTVLNVFDKLPKWKDYVIFKEFGYRLFI